MVAQVNPTLFNLSANAIDALRRGVKHVDTRPLAQGGRHLLQLAGETVAEFRKRPQVLRDHLAAKWQSVFDPQRKKRMRDTFVHCELRRVGNRMVRIAQLKQTCDDDLNVEIFALTMAGRGPTANTNLTTAAA